MIHVDIYAKSGEVNLLWMVIWIQCTATEHATSRSPFSVLNIYELKENTREKHIFCSLKHKQRQKWPNLNSCVTGGRVNNRTGATEQFDNVTEQTRGVLPMLFQCWPAGPALKQHWVDVFAVKAACPVWEAECTLLGGIENHVTDVTVMNRLSKSLVSAISVTEIHHPLQKR